MSEYDVLNHNGFMRKLNDSIHQALVDYVIDYANKEVEEAMNKIADDMCHRKNELATKVLDAIEVQTCQQHMEGIVQVNIVVKNTKNKDK